MVAAVERILGDHINEGIASVPVGSVLAARDSSLHCLSSKNAKIRCFS